LSLKKKRKRKIRKKRRSPNPENWPNPFPLSSFPFGPAQLAAACSAQLTARVALSRWQPGSTCASNILGLNWIMTLFFLSSPNWIIQF